MVLVIFIDRISLEEGKCPSVVKIVTSTTIVKTATSAVKNVIFIQTASALWLRMNGKRTSEPAGLFFFFRFISSFFQRL
ncbi:MAG: hypothetical protein APZ16_01835 [Candidatus Hadarchaeum yellowstonense]|uniref:Uncharacterized protein n=1 Tax=Hadarchaeum yellowstonense TaxID=1776334 RepID=A0A147K1B2_HADYE|nr:MAG: hypothetical protein APZ16_01835 [Candidatus Hadarchaeum yellowstonense]